MKEEDYISAKKVINSEREKQQAYILKKYKINDGVAVSEDDSKKFHADTDLYNSWKEEKLKSLEYQYKKEKDEEKNSHVSKTDLKQDTNTEPKTDPKSDPLIMPKVNKMTDDDVNKIHNELLDLKNEIKDKFKEKNKMTDDQDVKRLTKELDELRYELKNAPKEKERDDIIRRSAKEAEDARKELKEFKEREFKEVCNGIECIKNDMKKFQDTLSQKLKKDEDLHSSITSKLDTIKTDFGSKFDTINTHFGSKFDTIKTDFGSKFDTIKTDFAPRFDNIEKHTTKIEKIEKDVDSQCKGMECLKGFGEKLDTINKNVNLEECPQCKKKGIPYEGSWCPFCRYEVPGWQDDKGEPLKGWEPEWKKFKNK